MAARRAPRAVRDGTAARDSTGRLLFGGARPAAPPDAVAVAIRPTRPCYGCGSTAYELDGGLTWRCRPCHPPPEAVLATWTGRPEFPFPTADGRPDS